ncbi:type II toxin-antitoxin system HipA family toxin [Parashewanella spongiae]|uniref:Type II toxin-antitoxin system HipA family toxin n=1 Tax=Parashewanella spongiae TaxID=342950 RepID=A0A3A6TYC3_9GAMM|nr:HipA domain-containing protein [Parashewanella spongiae]MCL1079272.1 HipA domain-containing protein [Parashewanella spongiae]RJY06480.1 type II toxin-antitoxin system HipA family toxin [Parashewanella spongiae]
MTKANAYRLDIKYAGQVIGNLSLDSTTNLLKLSYSPLWQSEGFAISPHLSLDNQHSSEVAYNFLDNALPEGEARKLLAENLGISEKNVYSQVRVIGNDLAGAVTFLPSSEKEQNQPSFRILEEEELITRLDNKEEFGLLTWDDQPRLSVAGVQDKLNVFIDENGNIGFGDGSLCSTHILKFEKRNCHNLVLNEFFCMKLSSAVGLPTADVEYRHFGPHPSLIVKRFDRKYDADSNKVMRRHVIDVCQALNLPRDYKYERNLGDGRDVQHIRDGASLVKLFEFTEHMSSPIESKQWLINWQLFNLMISNYDSHGKNVSLFFDRNNARFTPAYDLVNIALFPQFKHVLAMAMGDEFEPNDIHAYQLADFAETCGIDKKLLSRLLTELANKVIKQLSTESLIDSLKTQSRFSDADVGYFKQLSDNILTRTEYLKAQAVEIPYIEV